MSRRAVSPAPPPSSQAYLNAFAGSGFMAAGGSRAQEHLRDEQEDDDARTVTDVPPYRSVDGHSDPEARKGPRPMPSQQKQGGYDWNTPTTYNLSPFSRADSIRSEGVFNFSDDRSIMPEDSVSQLQRGFTGKKPQGPRAMQPMATMHEDESDGISFVPTPDMIKLEGPTVVPASNYAAHERYPSQPDEDEEHVESYRSIRDSAHSNARVPLVDSAAPIAGTDYEHQTSRSGYSPAGHDEDEYAAYRNYGPDLERARHPIDKDHDDDEKKGFFGNAWSTPMNYLRSVSSSGTATYPPTPGGGYDSKAQFVAPGEVDASHMQPAPLWQRLFWDTTPVERLKYERRNDIRLYKWGYTCFILSIAMIITLIIELVRMRSLTGSAIQTKPVFNPMIGPSGEVLINLGARFAGCMKFITGVSDISWVCLPDSNQATVTSDEATCTMSQICGFGGFPANDPNQSFRFVLPIFLHAGVVHLLVNLLAQLSSSCLVERQFGAPKFLVIYFLSGTFGFILGSNFALVGQPSVGASGAIFGTHAAFLVDLVAHWSLEDRPKRKLFGLLVEIVIGFGLGYVPGVDNFAHLGGFLMGLLCSILLIPVIIEANARVRKIVWIVLRVVAAALIIMLFVVLLRNFYNNDPSQMCPWCRYLSCWPTAANNRCKGTGIATFSTSSSTLGSIMTIIFTTLVMT